MTARGRACTGPGGRQGQRRTAPGVEVEGVRGPLAVLELVPGLRARVGADAEEVELVQVVGDLRHGGRIVLGADFHRRGADVLRQPRVRDVLLALEGPSAAGLALVVRAVHQPARAPRGCAGSGPAGGGEVCFRAGLAHLAMSPSDAATPAMTTMPIQNTIKRRQQNTSVHLGPRRRSEPARAELPMDCAAQSGPARQHS